ncbi:serine--tRNA ligase, partial [Mycoplasmopsis pullorum]
MLNIKYILENEQKIRTDLVNRGFDISIYDRLVELGKVRGNLMFEAQQKKAELSKFSKQFAVLKNQPEELKKVKNEIAIIKKEQIELEEKAKSLNDELDQLLLAIPNEPLDGTPVGKDENFNKVLNVRD